VLTLTRREVKLPVSRLLPWSGPASEPLESRQEIILRLAAHAARREEIASRVDPLELWELAQGEVERAGAEWFASLIFSDPDADAMAAVGRALLEQKTHFKFQPPEFVVLPRETAEARQAEQEAAREREQLVIGGQAFFGALMDARSRRRPPPSPPADEALARRLRALVLAAVAGTLEHEEQQAWKAITKVLPDDPHLPLHLARAWGLVSEHHNLLLDQEGYAWGDDWSAQHAEQIRDVAARFATRREEPEATPYLSIDSATTLDIDDAFALDRTADGGFRLRLALSCPALDWPFGSTLDTTVRERGSSIYLPEGTSHMLPEALGLDLYSLRAGMPRPALVLECRLDSEGRQLSAALASGTVAAENSTYEKAEADLDSDRPDGRIVTGLELTGRLRGLRIAGGAVIVQRPETKVVLSEGEQGPKVEIEVPEPCPRAQLLVSELMILANAAVGKWAADSDLPLLYRTQDIALPADAAGEWSSAEDAFRVVRLLTNTLLEATPKPHACIAAPAYAPVTSPLRRYPDLLNQGQILHFLETDRPRWTREDLERMLPMITARVEAAGRIQRYRTRYWKLVYLLQHKDQAFEAVVVDDGNLVTAALPREQIFVRAPRDIFGAKLYPGQRFLLRLARINPLENEIRVAEAWED